MQQSDMRIDARNYLAVQFKDEAQNTMSRGMLRPKIDRKVAKILFVHGQAFGSAFSSPGSG